MTPSIQKALDTVAELAGHAVKMRAIIDNPNMDSGMRYRAAVLEEDQLQLIARYIDHIQCIKEKAVDGVRYV